MVSYLVRNNNGFDFLFITEWKIDTCSSLSQTKRYV